MTNDDKRDEVKALALALSHGCSLRGLSRKESIRNACRYYAAMLRYYGYAQERMWGEAGRISFSTCVGAAAIAFRNLAADLWEVWKEGGKVLHLGDQAFFLSPEDALNGINALICRHIRVPVEPPLYGYYEGLPLTAPLVLDDMPSSRAKAEELARKAFAECKLADVLAECAVIVSNPDAFAETFS